MKFQSLSKQSPTTVQVYEAELDRLIPFCNIQQLVYIYFILWLVPAKVVVEETTTTLMIPLEGAS